MSALPLEATPVALDALLHRAQRHPGLDRIGYDSVFKALIGKALLDVNDLEGAQ